MMGLFEHWPYVNFHDMNLDWIIKKIKNVETAEANSQASAEASADSAAASQLSADAALASQESARQSELNASESEDNAAGYEASAKNYADHIADPVAGLVTDWLNDNITPTTPAVDASLTISGAAADAKVTGDRITELKNNFTYLTQFLDENEKIDGEFYYKNNITTGTSANYCRFPYVNVKAGVLYTLINVRPSFCNFKTGNTITSLDPDDAAMVNKTITFTPESDGELYITGGSGSVVMLFNADYQQTNYVFGDFDYKIKNDVIGKQITEQNCTFFIDCYQYLINGTELPGYWNISGGGTNKVDWSSNENVKRFPKIRLKAGTHYTLINVYGYFCLIADSNDNVIERATDDTAGTITLEYTPNIDCYLYTSVLINNVGSAMVCDNVDHLPETYTEGLYYTYLDADIEREYLNITVKQDGTGNYTSVVEAVNYANGLAGKFPVNIYVYTGDYDILDELGGQAFIDTIESSLNERQGLVLIRNNVNLIGVGTVVFRFEMPDTVTLNQSTRVSCLNLREFTNSVENITLIAKNCRYVIHDETNGGNPHIHRTMKNLRCIHKGNISGLWPYPTVMGGGAGGGSVYDVINCQFITSSYHQAFSYHTNYNEEASFFNIDGCVASVKDDAPNKISFRFSYHGEGRTGICVANVKCCSGNGQTMVQPEVSSDTDNNIEMYVNGWNNINPIPVTGNE